MTNAPTPEPSPSEHNERTATLILTVRFVQDVTTDVDAMLAEIIGRTATLDVGSYRFHATVDEAS